MSKALTVRVSLDFLDYALEHKLEFSDIVIGLMTLNSGIFTTPDVTMLALQALRDDLNTKNLAAAGGDHLAILARNASELAWDAGFKTEANYVTHKAAGDLVMIGKSGFHATHSEATPSVRPGKAVITAYAPIGSHNTIHAEIKAVKGSKGTLFIAAPDALNIQDAVVAGNQITLNINGNLLVLAVTTKHTVEITGLTIGQHYGVAALAFNPAGLGDRSEPAPVIVQ